MTSNDIPTSTRRTLLCGAALASAGAAGLALTACERRDPVAHQAPTEPVSLGPTAEVPVGGTQLYREAKVLIHRSAEGEFRAFSAVCTHAGCVLSGIRDELAVCSCHGSTFDPATGDVLTGPAETPLPELPLSTENGTLVVNPVTR